MDERKSMADPKTVENPWILSPGPTVIAGARLANSETPPDCEHPQPASYQEPATHRPAMAFVGSISWRKRLGGLALLIFVVGTPLVLASLGFLAFLWFGDISNGTWRSVMSRNWLARAVAICSEVLKQAIAFQIGTAAAMLAALAVQAYGVPLARLPSHMLMHATSTGSGGNVFTLLWLHVGGGFGQGSLAVGLLAVLLAVVFAVAQASSILLFADVGLAMIPGTSASVNTTFSLYGGGDHMVDLAAAWGKKAAFYPAFAEYSEPPYVADGVTDTGVTLRAFLPFATAQDRETLYTYGGNATVLDARVTCQVPALSGENFEVPYDIEGSLLLRGSLAASRYTPRLGNATRVLPPDDKSHRDQVLNVPVPFNCLAPLQEAPGEWRVSLCQLDESGDRAISGGLVSEFKDLSTWWALANAYANYRSTYGTAYLLINVTLGDSSDWVGALGQGGTGNGTSPPNYSVRDEWMDLVFSEGRLVVSTTLCYAAFDFADIFVSISSGANRTETAPAFDPVTSSYTFASLRHQFGQDNTSSPEDRGILRLANQSWLATPDENAAVDGEWNYLRLGADLSKIDTLTSASEENSWVSAILRSNLKTFCPPKLCSDNYTIESGCAAPDTMHVWLFQEILRTGGSPAFAVQSMLTLLSSMTYYDQMGNFDRSAKVQQAFFVTANVPVARRGFAVVAAAVGLHVVLTAAVAALFLARTRFGGLGAPWAVLGQAATGEAGRYAEVARAEGEERAEEEMKADGAKGLKVCVGLMDDGRPGVVRFRPNGGR